MRLLEALYAGTAARIEKRIEELSSAIVNGSMKDHTEYKRQTGEVAGLKAARSMLINERRAILQPLEKKPETEDATNRHQA